MSNPTRFEIPIASNKTIIGVGATAHLIGGGFAIEGTSNITLRNLEISDTRIPEHWAGKTEDWDGVQVDAESNIWLDHLEVSANEACRLVSARVLTVNGTACPHERRPDRSAQRLRLHHRLQQHFLRAQQSFRHRLDEQCYGESDNQRQLLQLHVRTQP